MKNENEKSTEEKDVAIIEPKQYGLEPQKAAELTKGLDVIIEERKVLIDAYTDVIELEITEETIPQFKELRLMIVKNRTQGIEKWHKVNKAYFLAGGRFVDAIKNKEIAENERMELTLKNAEKYFDNLEIERIQKLQDERMVELKKYLEEGSQVPENLGNMEESMWNSFLKGTKATYEEAIALAKQQEEQRLEEERKVKLYNDRKELLIPFWNHLKEDHKSVGFGDLSQEQFDIILKECKDDKETFDVKQETIRLENERLQKEAKEKEEQIEEERKEIARKELDAKEEAERKEREYQENLDKIKADADAETEKIAKELKAKEEAEAEEKRLEEERIQNELNKGDAAKVNDLIADLEALKTKYLFKSKKNQNMYVRTGTLIEKVILDIKS